GRPADRRRLSADRQHRERRPAAARPEGRAAGAALPVADSGRGAAHLPGARTRVQSREAGIGARQGMNGPAIDLNCDMGESLGPWKMGNDLAILEHVTSANIACGFHAGDPLTMMRTVKAAFDRGVKVGAHPGFPDLVGFGRRSLQVSAAEAHAMVVYQVGAIAGVASALGGRLNHVKAHGALYNMAARDGTLADAIARAVKDVDPGLILFGLAGSELIAAAERIGLRHASEVFGDR